jgi:cytochrome P450
MAVSFSSPEAFYDIYSHAATNVLKDEYYDAIAGAYRSSGNTRSREEHTRKRRVIASSFSPKGVSEYEPCILQATQNLLDRLEKLMGESGSTAFNITPYIHMFTFDSIGAVLFSNTFHFLENGNDVCTAETPEGEQYQVHAMASFLDGVRFSTNLGYFGTTIAKFLKKHILWCTHGAKMGANFANMSIYRIRRRQEIPAEEAPHDVWSRFIAANNKPEGYKMPFGELIAESNSLVSDVITLLRHAMHMLNTFSSMPEMTPSAVPLLALPTILPPIQQLKESFKLSWIVSFLQGPTSATTTPSKTSSISAHASMSLYANVHLSPSVSHGALRHRAP